MERARGTQDLVVGRGQHLQLVSRPHLVAHLTPQTSVWN